MCLRLPVVTANIQHFCWILGPNLLCCVHIPIKIRCIYTTTGRRSPKAWQTLKVSARLHSEDAYSQSRQQGFADLCFEMSSFKINLFLGSRLLFVNCGRKYDKRRRQPEAVFESRVTSNGWHRSGSTSLTAVTLKGCDKGAVSVSSYDDNNNDITQRVSNNTTTAPDALVPNWENVRWRIDCTL